MRAVIAFVCATALSCVACGHGDQAQFHGVRLGMAPRDVRDRFDAGNQGDWKISPGEDMTLDWQSKDVASSGSNVDRVEKVRFEFHSGMLVALRAVVPLDDPWAAGNDVSLTPASLAARSHPDDKHVLYTLLARDCPTHREEEKRLIETMKK